MKRALFALSVLLFGTLSATSAFVFHFGCCVLPLHDTLHKIAPMCAMRKVAPPPSNQKPATAPRPAERFVPARAVTTSLITRSINPVEVTRVLTLPRNRVAQGALRCDDDVGLHTLFATFLI